MLICFFLESFILFLNFVNIALKMEKALTWIFLDSFCTSQKAAILTGVCRPLISTVCVCVFFIITNLFSNKFKYLAQF